MKDILISTEIEIPYNLIMVIQDVFRQRAGRIMMKLLLDLSCSLASEKLMGGRKCKKSMK
jgi:hypothetical protein